MHVAITTFVTLCKIGDAPFENSTLKTISKSKHNATFEIHLLNKFIRTTFSLFQANSFRVLNFK